MTNQGDLVNKIMRGGNAHEKEYIVTIDRPVTESFLKKMAGSLWLSELQTWTRPCRVRRLGENTFFYHSDPGTESSDPPDVPGLRLPGAALKADPDYEY